MNRAESAQDHTGILHGHVAVGITLFWMGDFHRAHEHLEAAVSLYDPEQQSSPASRYGAANPAVAALSYLALVLWHLGYPVQALKKGHDALTLAQAVHHPFSLGFALGLLSQVQQDRGEPHLAQETSDALIALCNERGFSNFLGVAVSMRGCVMITQQDGKEGLAQMKEGLAASQAAGADLWRPYFMTLLAGAYLRIGRFDDGFLAVAEALDVTTKRDTHNYEAETHRIKGELLLQRIASKDDATEALNSLERAVGIARQQGANSLELRATTSLARLLAKQGRRDEARTMLAEIYDWFSEGFDTADLKEAKALLDELGN